MHIVITTLWFPSKKDPLYGVFILEQARHLATFAEVTVLVSRRQLLPYSKEYKIGKVNVIEKGGPFLPNSNESRLLNWSKYYLDMFDKVTKDKKVDIIHCHDYIALYPTRQINLKFGTPYVVTIHNTDFLRDRVQSWRKPYINDGFIHSYKVIAVGKTLAYFLEDYVASDHIKVIPNIVDTNLFSFGVPKNKSPFKFLFVGNYESRKRVMILLDAFRILDDEDARLTCIGYGELKKEMIKFVNKYRLHHKVDILDTYPNTELPKFYQSHHCYISVSEAETYGITVVEAMSCGMHIIYNKSGGPEHLVPQIGTLLIQEVTAKKLSKKMNEMIVTFNLSASKTIRDHVVNNFSKGLVISSLLDEYREAISN